MSLYDGKIIRQYKDGLLVYFPCDRIDEYRAKNVSKVTIEVIDGRTITGAQRRKIYALIRCISIWSGYIPSEVIKTLTKMMLLEEQDTLKHDFSLSNCSVDEGKKYITWLIDFCLLHDIPCGEPLWKLCEDIPRYVYAAAIHKRCAVCGKNAEIHHVDAVGSGRNRKEIIHLGMKILPLCRSHHMDIHRIGKNEFLKRYLLEAVKADDVICSVYHLKA